MKAIAFGFVCVLLCLISVLLLTCDAIAQTNQCTRIKGEVVIDGKNVPHVFELEGNPVGILIATTNGVVVVPYPLTQLGSTNAPFGRLCVTTNDWSALMSISNRVEEIEKILGWRVLD